MDKRATGYTGWKGGGGIPVCLLVFLLFASLNCGKISGVRVLYLAHANTTTHPIHKGLLYLKKVLEEKSGRKMTVKVFADGQLGSEREVLELLQIGSVAMTKVSAAVMANFAPEYEILSVPYLYRDADHAWRVRDSDIGQEILASSTKYLLKGLCYYDAGFRSFYTKDKPIRTPDDLKGLKIRVMNHKMSIDMVAALGGAATPMAYGELYTALQQGVVDGAENNEPSFVSSNHYEVCKYYTLDEHVTIPDVLVISTKFWNTLSEQEQAWLNEAAQESAQAEKVFWQESVDECMRTLEAAHVEIIRPDKEPFAERTQAVRDQFGKNPKMQALMDRINNM